MTPTAQVTKPNNLTKQQVGWRQETRK